MLVDAIDVEVWSADQTRGRLLDAVRDNPFLGHALVRFADQELLVDSWDATFDDAIEAIARAIERGVITPVRIASAEAGLRPIVPGATPIRWDELQLLSDLARPGPTRGVPGTPRHVTPTWVDPRDAWMSFDVVDDRGAPADGHFRVVVDGEADEGRLERTTHTFRGLSTSATGRVRIDSLSFTSTSMHLDGPVPGGTPTVPRDGPLLARGASFEVVDDEGRPVVGRYVVRTPAGERGGRLAGIVVVDEVGADAARVKIFLGEKATDG